MTRNKQEVITFKVDKSLAELIKKIPNRSEFIRNAILSTLENVCPLCQGTGILDPLQKKHWEEFSKNHTITNCEDCDSFYIECRSKDKVCQQK